MTESMILVIKTGYMGYQNNLKRTTSFSFLQSFHHYFQKISIPVQLHHYQHFYIISLTLFFKVLSKLRLKVYLFEPLFTFEIVNTSIELFDKLSKSTLSSLSPEQFTGRRTKIPIIPANTNTFKLHNPYTTEVEITQ